MVGENHAYQRTQRFIVLEPALRMSHWQLVDTSFHLTRAPINERIHNLEHGGGSGGTWAPASSGLQY